MPRIANLIRNWKEAGCDDVEVTRRLVDLFTVSVLLDAGAGNDWRYVEAGTGHKYERSEGIAVASLHIFESQGFTSDKSGNSPLVDGEHISGVTSLLLF